MRPRPFFDYRLDADRLAEVLGLVAEPLRRLTGLGDAELADLLQDLDEEAAAAGIALALAMVAGADDVLTQSAYCVSYIEDISLAAEHRAPPSPRPLHPAAGARRPHARERAGSRPAERKRRIYPTTGVFGVDLADWRNVKEDRRSTATEVMNHFEFEYADWLELRYERVWASQTHCRLFDSRLVAEAARARDAEDFRELGHRVVETHWTP